jgi:murein DD-endopeptidase MepM/ murein hydrolase activator NlpD
MFWGLILMLPSIVLGNINLNHILDKQSENESNMTQIKAAIESIDKKIGANNDSYLDSLKKEKFLEEKISELESDLKKSKKSILFQMGKMKKKVNFLLLEKFKNDFVTKEVQEKILLKELSVEGKKLEDILSANLKSQNSLELLHQKFSSLVQEKKQVYEILGDLELKKTKKSHEFGSYISQNKVLKEKIDEIATITKIEGNSFSLITPIDRFDNVAKHESGLNFFFEGRSPIRAMERGKVVYSSSLANYGNVVMIEHDKDLRSLVLGKFSSKVTRGDIVTKNSTIGYFQKPGRNSLYVELREKENPINITKYFKNLKL